MKSLFFRKGDDESVYWRCGRCGQDGMTNAGTVVKVGPDVLAIVCVGCIDAVKLEVGAVAPRSFPEVDAMGSLVEDGGAAQAEAPRSTATPR